MTWSKVVSYAQNMEDMILDSFFKNVKKGFYVDVGANDPIIDSVTKHFYDKGWTGINIEPVKSCYEKLTNHRPRDINLQIGVSDKSGTMKLTEYEHSGLSTFSKELKREYKRTKSEPPTAKEYDVEIKTLKSVFDQNNVSHIHFLKVDVEGLEFEVLNSNDWKRYRPEMVCVEANHVIKDWRQLLIDNDYYLVFYDGLNEYYLSRENKHREKLFNYAEDILVNKRVIQFFTYVDLEEAEKTISELKTKIEEEKKHFAQEQARLQKRISDLSEFADDFKKKPFKFLLKAIITIIRKPFTKKKS